MSHKAFDELTQKGKRARINAAMRNLRANVHGDGEDNVQDNRRSPPVDEVMDINDEEGPGIADIGVHNWDNFLQQLNVNENNENLVLVAEPVDDIGRRHEIENQYVYNMENLLERDDDAIDPSSDEEGEDDADDGNTPLYHRATITVKESMLAILSLMLRHNLNMTCVSDIISMVQLHCPERDRKPNSLYHFKKYFKIRSDNNITKHYYCSKCLTDLQGENNICPRCQQRKSSSFIELPIKKHLREMYRRQNFFNQLQLRFMRPVQPDNTISDVYDGKLYQDWVAQFLGDPHNISFTWYTDGVPVFKSSKVSAWPLCLVINEIPYAERKKKENILLLGLWYGDQKPHFNFFFYKLRSIIEEIYRGIRVYLPDGNAITVRGIVLMGTCDLPAKCDCLNFTQFNGKYGCPVCFTPGQSMRSGPKSSVQTYPYIRDIEERSSRRCNEYANEARPGAPVFGVRGHSALSRLMPDFVRGMGIDRMHAVDGGVMKKILELCCHEAYSNSPFSLTDYIPLINSRLTSIKPPKFVHRMPRSIDDLVHWKASELKMFLFYYAIPVFNGIMDEEHLNNLLRLIVATAILSANEITLDLIDVAEDLLNRFVREFQKLYGAVHCTINVHLLLHLPNCVRNLGPLWLYSCYAFEDFNGYLLKLIHGTCHLETQIATSHSQIIKMVRLTEELPPGPIRDFCSRKKHQVNIIEKVFDHTFSVGAYKCLRDIPDIIGYALRNSAIDVEQFRIWNYFRLLKEDKLYTSVMYTRHLQTSSSTVQYIDDRMKFGIVHCFLRLKDNLCQHANDCECPEMHYAVIRGIECDDIFIADGDVYQYSTQGFIQKCHETDEIKAIPIQFIMSPCLNINIDNQLYVITPINNKELE